MCGGFAWDIAELQLLCIYIYIYTTFCIFVMFGQCVDTFVAPSNTFLTFVGNCLALFLHFLNILEVARKFRKFPSETTTHAIYLCAFVVPGGGIKREPKGAKREPKGNKKKTKG